MKNAEFAKTNSIFTIACDLASEEMDVGVLNPTKRQASKWRNCRGLAYKYRNAASRLMVDRLDQAEKNEALALAEEDA